MKSLEREKLEDFIIAILLHECQILKTPQGKALAFTVEKRKEPLLRDYLKRFNLNSYVEFDSETLEGYLLPSFILERILRIWVKNDKVYVIDPSTLRINALFILIALFAKNNGNSVYIPSSLERDLQNSLAHFFELSFRTNLITGKLMKIKPFSPVVLKAIQYNRSIEESMEITHLLPSQEKEALKEMVLEWEKEISHYAL